MTTSDLEQARRRLRTKLDDGPRLALLALADLEGDADTAAGYRWLAEHRRQPGLIYFGGDGERSVSWRPSPELPHSDGWRLFATYLPWGAFDRLASGPHARCGRSVTFASASEAFHAAAKAVGVWLREEGGEGSNP